MAVPGPWISTVVEVSSYMPATPGRNEISRDLPGTRQGGFGGSGRFVLSSSLASSLALIYPSQDAGARSCVAHHISQGSRGADVLGSGLNVDWDPGECPPLGVTTPLVGNSGLTVIGYAVDFFDGSPLQASSFTMTAGQRVTYLEFVSDWSATGETLTSLLASHLDPPVVPPGATVEYRITGLSLSIQLYVLGYEASARECTVVVSEYVGAWPPTEWIPSSGSTVVSLAVNGVITLGATAVAAVSSPVPIKSYSAPPVDRIAVLLSSPQTESGTDPGRPLSGNAVDRNCRANTRLAWIAQYGVDYRFIYDGVPPLRQRQRNDGLTGSSAPRALHRTTSRQSSNRQHGYW